MPEFVRVKDKTTGHEFSVRVPNPAKVDVIDKPAVDLNSKPLPAKPKVAVKPPKPAAPALSPAKDSERS